jgi:hypothetical protein
MTANYHISFKNAKYPEYREQACQFPTKKGFHLRERGIYSGQIKNTTCGKFPNFKTPSQENPGKLENFTAR